MARYTEMEVAKLMFGWGNVNGSGSVYGSSTSTRYGTVTAVNDDGTVDILLDSGETITLKTDTPLAVDDRVVVVVQGGTYMVYAAAGYNRAITELSEREQELTNYANEISESLDELRADISDGMVSTWFYATDPTTDGEPVSSWSDPSEHAGDIYYNTVSGKMWYWTQSGSSWVWEPLEDEDIASALANAATAQDTADGKRTVFYGTSLPTPPYQIGDLWSSGTDATGNNSGELMVCIVSRASGATAQTSDWEPASNYSERISDIEEELTTFSDTLQENTQTLSDLESQIDGKVETWFYAYVPTTSNLPASGWSSTDKTNHTGDLFFNTSTGYCYRWTGSAWSLITDSRITTAMNTASAAQDTADSKRQVFYTTTSSGTPSGPYDVGDLWVNKYDGNLYVCKTARTTSGYSSSHWVLATDYTDDTAVTTLANTFTLSKTSATVQWRAANTSNSWSNSSTSVTWYIFQPTDITTAPTLFWTSLKLSTSSATLSRAYGTSYMSYYEYRIKWPSGIGSMTQSTLPEIWASAICDGDIARCHVWARDTTYCGPVVLIGDYSKTITNVRIDLFCTTRVSR